MGTCLKRAKRSRFALELVAKVGLDCPPEPTRREYNHLYSLVADINNQALLPTSDPSSTLPG